MVSTCAIAVLLSACLGAEPSEAGGSIPLDAEGLREGTQVRFVGDERGAIMVQVESKSGIGEATIRRRAAAWPRQIVLRMHLRGLESLKVKAGNAALEWSVASHGENAASVSLKTSDGTAEIDRDSPYFADVQIVAKDRKIPLQDGFFEIDLPRKILAENPETIEVSWIDFYRQ